MSENPEVIELEGLPLIYKLCAFADKQGMQGRTWTEIVEELLKELEESKAFESRYLCAIKNAKKPKNRLNWAHVASLGVSSGTAVDLCKKFGINPSGTEMRESESEQNQ
ncbi:hypothetical protein [Acinetobacter soli]|uniref:hypothetical protein n=1 Tax=Acinetobacter soli TaxID=487316 RepID=UPI0012509212|nr:hypothetical protein [Acinetobacter soli]